MNKKHTFLLLFLALSLSLWGSFSLIKHWKNNNENAVKEYEITKNEKEENTKLSVKEYKGFLAEIPQNLYKKVSISALNAKTLPKLSTDIINLTAEADGYRLRPLGLKFKTPINIEVEYDENKIPKGYTEKDVLLLSFNRQKKSWERISVDEINEGKNLLKGKISQSSDFIAGIIKLPESPDTSGFTPTSISGLKAADPLSGVQSIAPPTANPEGSATTSFAIELPKGRAGMQPSVSLQYSNDGGHSWVGQGWNLSLPSVNIDTRWGAPRYDAQKETESYILSGEDLLPNTHRAEWENRSSDKIFYPRREGAFSKIIRKGNHPNNYHWEVSSKSGIISYYGNNANSVSRTASGNNAHWQISEQRDLRGNKVEYEYTSVEGILYPKAIYYTGHGGEKGKYSVHFITDLDLGETPRADVQVSARLGLKQVYNRLLRKIEIKYDNQMVRSYELVYGKGEYEKTLLKEIRQYDAEGNLFYTNAMSYYNDVRDENGNYTPFEELKEWSVPTDGIKYEVLGVGGLSGKPSLVGTSDSKSTGSNYRLGIGPLGGKFKELTVGGHGGHSSSETRSKVLLQDIDGDNLPDKIFIGKAGISYRKNLSTSKEGNFNIKFAEAKPIVGLSHLGITKNKSHNYGVDLQAYINSGYNWQKSKSTTRSYFMDFNGDGLVDFADKGKVYYNRLVGGIPTFIPQSTGTPAPVHSGSAILSNAPSTITKEELEKKNPLHDVVRTWTAPYSGDIFIKHQYKLLENNTPERKDYTTNDGKEKADGVKLYIQHRNIPIWKTEIGAKDHRLNNEEHSFRVNKGDVVYFRISSNEDGNFDETHWIQHISYTAISDTKDINDLSLKDFSSETDLLWGSEMGHLFSKPNTPTLQGIWEKKTTTDQVTLQVLKFYFDGDIFKTTILAEKTLSEQAENYDISQLNIGSFLEGESIGLRMISKTEVDWQSVVFTPQLSFINDEGKQEVKPLPIDYHIYYKLSDEIEPQYLMPSQKGKLSVSISDADRRKISDNRLNGEILITAKQEGRPVERKRYQTQLGTLSDITKAEDKIVHTPVLDSIKADKNLYFEISFSSKKLYQSFKDLNINILAQVKDSIKISDTDPRYPNEKYEIKTTNQSFGGYASYVLLAHPEVETKFGKAYRGWGHFILNGTLAGETIDETQLILATENQSAPNTDHFDENADHSSSEISNKYMLPFQLDIAKKQWSGLEDDIFVSQNHFSPSRLGENDLLSYLDTSLPILQGGESRSLEMITESKSKGFTAGAGIASVSLGVSGSNGETFVLQTMNDFNGDRFPDAIQNGTIQFTSPLGSLSEQKNLHFGHFSESKTSSEGGSANGSFSHGEAKTTSAPTIYASKSQKVSAGLLGGKDAQRISPSLSAGSGDDTSVYTHMDINGDGLADRVYGDGKIAYNLGYGFSSVEQWQGTGNLGLGTGESDDWSAGLGFSLYGGSFTGGINYSCSTSDINTQLLDLNSDGLLDRIAYDRTNNKILVYQNLGNRWHHEPMEIPMKKGDPIGKNTSISWGGNAGFSIGINLWLIRIVPSFGKSIGNNTSKVEATFTDVDGDGHLDYVLSEDEDDLWVAKNKFGKTNMLKGVTNGAGNSWEIDYEWKAPTYANPNSAWVLKSVKLFDGHIGDGEDYTLSKFEYDKPYYDRRERTFYGYEVVKQEAINPQDNSVLRTSVQEFYNQDYFRKSLLKSAYTLGKNGQKLSESSVKYHITNARTGVEIQSSTLNLPETDATSVFIAPSEEIHREYEDKAKPYVWTPPPPRPIVQNPTPPKKGANQPKVIRVPHTTNVPMPYLFNGKELDYETGLYYYGARYYDPKTALWLNTDPLAEKYPNVSPYTYTLNNPIKYIDPDGREPLHIIFRIKNSNNNTDYRYHNGKFYNTVTNKVYTGGNKTLDKVQSTFDKINSSNDVYLKNMLTTLEKSDKTHIIQESKFNRSRAQVSSENAFKAYQLGQRVGSTVFLSLDEGNKEADAQYMEYQKTSNSDGATIVHELKHSFDFDQGYMKGESKVDGVSSPAETRSIIMENKYRRIEGTKPRLYYDKVKVDFNNTKPINENK